MDQQPGGGAAKRALPGSTRRSEALPKVPRIYDTRVLRAGGARDPSGTAAPTGGIVLPALRRAGLLPFLPRLEVPLQMYFIPAAVKGSRGSLSSLHPGPSQPTGR